MRVLVTAASRHGSTAEIAEIIAGVLRSADIETDVLAPEHVATVVGYDAVILGSAVYGGHWLDPAKAFVIRHQEDLVRRPVFLFSSGPLGDPLKPPEEPDDAYAIEDSIRSMDLRVFAGRLTKSQLSRSERLIVRLNGASDGDFRPWDDIADWAMEIARYLNDPLAEPVSVS